MSRVLVDSSVWIEVLRGDRSARMQLSHLARDRGIVTCEPVMMEILSGARRGDAHRIESFLDGFLSLPLRAELDFRFAALVRRRLRDRGLTLRSGMDALIATIAINHGATVLHQDSDFERIATVAELRQERWAA